jgi:hypothetical protein
MPNPRRRPNAEEGDPTGGAGGRRGRTLPLLFLALALLSVGSFHGQHLSAGRALSQFQTLGKGTPNGGGGGDGSGLSLDGADGVEPSLDGGHQHGEGQLISGGGGDKDLHDRPFFWPIRSELSVGISSSSSSSRGSSRGRGRGRGGGDAECQAPPPPPNTPSSSRAFGVGGNAGGSPGDTGDGGDTSSNASWAAAAAPVRSASWVFRANATVNPRP